MSVKLIVHHRDRANAGEGYQYALDQARIVIGRSAGADVRLPSLTVSEHHATLERTPRGFSVRDEHSTNGTRVGAAVLVAGRSRQLAQGDDIFVGEFVLRFEQQTGLLPMPPERTASLARRLLREVSGAPAEEDPPKLLVKEGPERGLSLRLATPSCRVTVGHAPASDVPLSSNSRLYEERPSEARSGSALSLASRSHASVEIERDQDGVLARDLSEPAVLVINGKPQRERRLKHGDVLRIESVELWFEDPAELSLRHLSGLPDLRLTTTEPLVAAEVSATPETATPAAGGELAEAAAEGPSTPAAQTALVAPTAFEKLVYVLATLVLGASVAGLVWLFS